MIVCATCNQEVKMPMTRKRLDSINKTTKRSEIFLKQARNISMKKQNKRKTKNGLIPDDKSKEEETNL